jgi:urea transport system ATP-binding protein
MTANADATAPEFLAVRDLVVSFDGFRVLDDLSFSIADGELRFLIGPNGAGKTTLMDVLSGKVRPQSGSVTFDGKEISKLHEDEIVRLGIGRKFQTPSVFGSLTCYENVEVASGFRTSLFRTLFAPTRRQREWVNWSLERVGLVDRQRVLASELSHGERQWLEIAMLLVQNARVLLLDEPVAGMTGEERRRTGELLHAVAGLHAIVITEHDMEFVREFARDVTVLHMGRVLREGPVAAIQQDEEVRRVYTGRTETAA